MSDRDVERLRELARDYHAPPAPPREAMWQAIRGRLGSDHGALSTAKAADRRVRRAHGLRWRRWGLPLAAAAALAVAFGLGRLSSPAPGGGGTPAARTGGATHYHAARHMADAETMLALVAAAPESARGEETAAWARELLTTTRLLLDSRAAEDPARRELLQDLELVLVQLANLPGAVAADELDFIRESMQRRELLTRVREAAGDADAAI